jgi:phosphohistidine phosphatase
MDVYLVQHGEAKSETEDPERPLTERGRDDVRRVAAFAVRSGLRPAAIRHSGKRRAAETAAIFAEALALKEQVTAGSGLAPNDDPQPLAESLRIAEQPIMLVGHLPFMSRLASLLLVGNADSSIVRFRMGGIVCVTREDSPSARGGWTLAWMITPEVVGLGSITSGAPHSRRA